VVPPSEIRGNPKSVDAFITGHLRQYEEVVEAMESGRPPAVTAQDGLMALALVHAVYVSATLRRPIVISALLAGDFDDVVLSVDPA
jgi:predicted dehydrogenase